MKTLPLALALVACVAIGRVGAQLPVAARNVNIVGGPTDLRLQPEFRILGDPNRSQQNEGSCAPSTVNPLHLLCGGNDHRIVDVPGVVGLDAYNQGAWGGNYQSLDGGSTWQSTLHPGFRLDAETDSPLKEYDFLTDAVLRSAAGGVTFYAGLAGTRETDKTAPGRRQWAVFVSTWVDLNDEEGDPFPFKHSRTVIVTAARGGRAVDKPWIAVGTPMPGQSCWIDVPRDDGTAARRRVPASPVYVAWAAYSASNMFQIHLSRSVDCGATWKGETLISEGSLTNQGVQIAVSPEPAHSPRVVVAWRRFISTNRPESQAIMTAVSNNGGQSFSKPVPSLPFCPFDQGTTAGQAYSFRSNAFPAMAIDYTGRAYIAFTARAPDCGTGQARIFLTSSRNGADWTPPVMVDPAPPLGHQIQPSIAVAGDRIQLLWLDFRNDASQLFQHNIAESAVLELPDGPDKKRHTGEFWGAQTAIGDIGPGSSFAVHQISEYITGIPVGETNPRRLQHDAVNVRMYERMTIPFVGDYSDVTGDGFVPSPQVPGSWEMNRGQWGNSSFLAAFTSNRDVKLLSDEDYNRPRPYEPPTIPNLDTSLADPSQLRPECISDLFSGTKNQNLYSSRIMAGGLFAGIPGNAKPGSIQRAFVAFAQNAGTESKTVRFTILNQPSTGRASFRQFDGTPDAGPLTTDGPFTVPPKSLVVRTVFVTAPAGEMLKVRVSEEGGGFSSTHWINHALADGASLRRPVSVPTSSPAYDPNTFEVHDVRIGGREIDHEELLTEEQIILLTGGLGPGWTKPPGWRRPRWANPEWGNPEWANPEWANPEWANPVPNGGNGGAWANPGWENFIFLTTPPGIRDIRFQLTSAANTASAYRAAIAIDGDVDPELQVQLVIYRLFASGATDGCKVARYVGHSDVLLNLTNESDFLNIDPANSLATFYLQPGDETTYVNVRLFDRSGGGLFFDPGRVTLKIQPQAVNTADAATGVTVAPVFSSSPLVISTTSLPDGEIGVPYVAPPLVASAGSMPYVWSLEGGSALPKGLSLEAGTGVISGTPEGPPGTTSFVARVIDFSFPRVTSTRAFTITIQ